MDNIRHEKDQSCDICAEKQLSEDKSTSKTSIEALQKTGSDGFWMTGTKPSGNSNVVNPETLQCREAVQPGPQFGLPIVEKLRLGLQKCREEISIAVLILAPGLKVL